jgi:hypothetical protein
MGPQGNGFVRQSLRHGLRSFMMLQLQRSPNDAPSWQAPHTQLPNGAYIGSCVASSTVLIPF